MLGSPSETRGDITGRHKAQKRGVLKPLQTSCHGMFSLYNRSYTIVHHPIVGCESSFRASPSCPNPISPIIPMPSSNRHPMALWPIVPMAHLCCPGHTCGTAHSWRRRGRRKWGRSSPRGAWVARRVIRWPARGPQPPVLLH